MLTEEYEVLKEAIRELELSWSVTAKFRKGIVLVRVAFLLVVVIV
jgi:hypothetical protein